MNPENRKDAFCKLGQILRSVNDKDDNLPGFDNAIIKAVEEFDLLIKESFLYNGWFTEDMVRNMVGAIGKSLEEENIDTWLDQYQTKLKNTRQPKTVAVVMAGNIPLVGFHDLLCVLLSGNSLLAKLSSDDNKLIPAIIDLLVKIDAEFDSLVKTTGGRLENFDAVIATGSNNTSRYFDYYFGKYPNIIRKNRNSVAVLSGEESEEYLEGLVDDIFLYYGLGCRNVSKLFVPEGYDFIKFLQLVEARKTIVNNNKYFNNYEYNKAIFLVNGTKHLDSGNLLLTENETNSSPVSVLYFENYISIDEVKKKLSLLSGEIQCIVTNLTGFENSVGFGKSQSPKLWEYADGVDTMEFLLSPDKL